MLNIVDKKPVTFIHGDCMEFLRETKEEMRFKYFHIGIVDPPYGISVGDMNLGATKDSKPRSYEMGSWDNAVPTQEYWDLLNYACRNLIIWGGNYFTDKMGQVSKRPYEREIENIVGINPGRCFIIWDKGDQVGKQLHAFAFGELALTTFDRNPVRIIRARNARGTDETDRRHPTQKPVYLYDYLHLNFVERGHKVLDTHGGSFNHAIAAYKNNVNLTIIEQDEGYFNSGIMAYNQASTKGRLLF